jgi:hypothetical protein
MMNIEYIKWYYYELTELLEKNHKLLNEMKSIKNPSKKFLKWIETVETTINKQTTRKYEIKVKYGL